MAVSFVTIYPKAITNAEWQKKKSFKDKLKKATKTGLGDALLKAEAAYKKIDFEILDAGSAGPKPTGKWRSAEQIMEAKVKAEKHYNDVVKPAARAMEVAASKARTTSQNTALSPAAVTAAKAISAGMLQHVVLLKAMKFDDFDAKADNFTKMLEMTKRGFAKKVLELERKLNDLAKEPTLAEWTKLDVKNGFRSVGNTLGNDLSYAKIWETWKPWDGLQQTRHPKLKNNPSIEVQKEVISEMIKEYMPEVEKLKRMVNV